jgi:tetratricopeptide (TPR) repeat protein
VAAGFSRAEIREDFMTWQNMMRAAVMLSCVAAIGCSEDPLVAAQEAMARGDAFAAKQQHQEATIEYRRAVQLQPRSGDARRKLADSLAQTNNPAAAFRELVRAADLLPSDPDLQVRVGALLLAAGRAEDAKARAEQAISAEPNHVGAHVLRGSALAGLKDLDAGLAEVERAIAIDPGSGATYASLGALQLARGNREQADVAFAKAVSLSPKSLPARLSYAQYLMATERATQAETQLKAAYDIEPQNVLINRILAVYYISTRRPQLAEPHLVQLASQTDPGAQLSLAQLYLASNRVDEGTALLERLAKEDATFEASTLLLARIAFARNDRAAGYARVQQVLDRFPQNPRALVVRAAFLLSENKTTEAADAATAATAADPNSAEAFAVLGAARRAQGQVEEARAAYTEVLKLRPGDVGTQLALSRLHLASGAVQQARQLAEQASQRAPEAPATRAAVVRTAIAAGDFTRAERELTTLLRDFPKAADVYNLEGMLRAGQKNMAAAERAFATAEKLQPTSFDAAAGLIGVDLANGRRDAARRRADRIVAEKSATVDALMLAATTYGRIGDLASTESVLRRAIQVDAARSEPYGMLGQLYAQQGRIDQALREFQAVADRQPKSVGAQTIVAVLLHQQNRKSEAKATYRKVLAIDASAPVAANNLAWLMMEDGENLDEAVQLAQRAKGRFPESGDIADTLGWLYFKKGLTAQALDELKAAVAKSAENATYQYHLGLVYAQSGYFDLAQKTLQAALKLNPTAPEAAEARKILARVGAP